MPVLDKKDSHDRPTRRVLVWLKRVCAALAILACVAFLGKHMLVQSIVNKYVYSYKSRMSSDELPAWQVALVVPEIIDTHRRLSERQHSMSVSDIGRDPSVFNARINAWMFLDVMRDKSELANEYISQRCASGDLFGDEAGYCDE